MAGTLPLDKMLIEENLRANWAGVITSPAWHEDVLAEREAMCAQGSDEFEDWEEAKGSIRSQVR